MRIDDSGDIRVQYLDADGPVITASNDTSDLIGNAWVDNVNLIAVPVARLDPEFVRLRSLMAGEIVQKLVNYQLQLAVIGDITKFVAASDAFRDFVGESNRGRNVWFLLDEDALEAKLAATR